MGIQKNEQYIANQMFVFEYKFKVKSMLNLNTTEDYSMTDLFTDFSG